MRRSTLLLSLGAVLLAPASAAAQNQWEQQIIDLIGLAGEVFRPEGYAQTGDSYTGTLNENGSDDFDIVLEGGVAYVLLGVCDVDCSDIDLMLLDSSGNEIDSDYQDDDAPVLEISPPRTATYRVHVFMAGCATEPCYYGVGLFAAVARDRPAGAAGAPSTQNYKGRLESGDSQLPSKEYFDAYPFQGNAGDAIVVDLFSSDFDPFLVLISPSGEDTQNDDYEGSSQRSRVEKVLDETGEWHAIATSFKPGSTGGYELSITAMRGGESSRGNGGTRFESGRLASDDETLSSGEYFDSYTVAGRAGEYVVVDLRSSEFDPYLIVITPGGEQLENDDHEGDAHRSQLALQLDRDGEYQVMVTSYKPGEVGAYDVRIEGTGARAMAGRVERGSLAAGDETLRSGEYADGYEFEGRPGQRVRLDVGSIDFDTYLILIDPNGEHIENDDAEELPGHSVIEADITEVGTYTVVVTSYEVGETGAYELSMDLGAAESASERQRDVVALPRGGGPSGRREGGARRAEGGGEGVGDVLGGATSGRLEAGDRRLESGEYGDLYVFDGEAGQRVSIEMSSSEFDTYLQLVTPDGGKIENDDDTGRADRSRIEITLRESGRYRILTTSYGAGETGTYRLALRALAAEEAPIATATRGARIFGVFAGISDYPGDANDLAYTAADAVRVRDALIRATGMRPEDAILLTDRQATVGAFESAVGSLSSRMGPEDIFVLFYSGHGSRVPRDGPEPADPDAMDETIELYDSSFTDGEMRELFEGVSAGTSLLVLDACFSGGFAKDVISVPGRMGLFSSEEDVTSSVAAKFRAGGYLAAFLADAIGDGLADGDGDGGVSAIELSQYLHERYRSDVKAGGADDYVRTGGPQLGYQHLVVDRGSIRPYRVLFQLAGGPGASDE